MENNKFDIEKAKAICTATEKELSRIEPDVFHTNNETLSAKEKLAVETVDAYAAREEYEELTVMKKGIVIAIENASAGKPSSYSLNERDFGKEAEKWEKIFLSAVAKFGRTDVPLTDQNESDAIAIGIFEGKMWAWRVFENAALVYHHVELYGDGEDN